MKRRSQGSSSYFDLSPPISDPIWEREAVKLKEFLKSGSKSVKEILDWRTQSKTGYTLSFTKNLLAYLSVMEIVVYNESTDQWQLA